MESIRAAAAAIIEHKRSHIVLLKGNASQSHAGDQNIVAIRGGATSKQLQERKEKADLPHKTVEKNIKKKIELDVPATGKEVRKARCSPCRSDRSKPITRIHVNLARTEATIESMAVSTCTGRLGLWSEPWRME